MKKNIYIIWIGGIGVSAIARYYLAQWYTVYGDDASQSVLTNNLEKEWVIFCSLEKAFETTDISKVIYTEAVRKDNHELVLASEKAVEIMSYPESLWEIANDKKLIAIAGTHGKSTTTSLTSLVLKNSTENFTAVVWTILKEFENKNFFHRNNWENIDDFFVIEACEYRRSFHKYTPTVWVIVNMEVDHLDYFKWEDDYVSAYKDFIENIKPWGFAVVNGDDKNCQKLLWLRDDIQYVEVFDSYFTMNEIVFQYPKITLQVAGNHILFDAKIAYIVWHMLGLANETIVEALENYTWVWRRMEHVGITENNNILMSDYGHHPTEIQLTLDALKEKHPDKKLITIFQPHQHNRTIELIEEFKWCFTSTDILIVPDIYASRDSEQDKKDMTTEKFVEIITHDDKTNGNWLENTLILINNLDKKYVDNSIILLLWAGNVDTLRYKIHTK